MTTRIIAAAIAGTLVGGCSADVPGSSPGDWVLTAEERRRAGEVPSHGTGMLVWPNGEEVVGGILIAVAPNHDPPVLVHGGGATVATPSSGVDFDLWISAAPVASLAAQGVSVEIPVPADQTVPLSVVSHLGWLTSITLRADPDGLFTAELHGVRHDDREPYVVRAWGRLIGDCMHWDEARSTFVAVPDPSSEPLCEAIIGGF